MTRISITTDIPARLDRLPWSRFHLLVVVALGVTWILDGLEVTIVGSIGPVLQNSQTLGLSTQEIGSAGSAYVIGAVVGALLFGWLTSAAKATQSMAIFSNAAFDWEKCAIHNLYWVVATEER
jgi:MFS family permease